MRILHVIPRLVVGGAERMVARLVGFLHRWGHTVGVVALYAPLDTPVEAQIREQGVPLQFLAKRPGLDARVIPRLASAIRTFRPDVIHTHMYVLKYTLPAMAIARASPSALAGVAARTFARPGRGSASPSPRCRVVHTLHTLAQHEDVLLGRIVQRAAFRAGVMPVAIGEAVAESIRKVYGLSPRHLIATGVPVSELAPPPGAREAVRAELAIPPDAPTFACIAQFEVAKNHEGLLAAFASERLGSRGAHLVLAGDGARRGELERRARDAHLAHRVHFLGVRSDVPRVLAAADAFVLASAYEGNPLSVMEAMAAGKPVLATAVGCVPELVAEGTGRLVPAGRPDALEAAMYELSGDLAAARAMGAEAARVARERFDDTVMAKSYERLYEELA